tara:strand:- start:2520 stop:3374 length:855 start_codon:yes stop_codon:yes gene_type:complete
MRKLIIILLVSNYTIAQTALLDTNAILIGEQLNFTLSNKVKNTEIWPTYEDFLIEGIEIIKASEIDTSNGVISQQFIITAWDSGSYYIPPITFSANNITEGLLLNVQTILLKEGAELKDIKQPMDAPIGWSDIWPWLLVLLFLGIVFYILKKYIFKKNKSPKIIKQKTLIPADVIALKKLSELENANFWQEGRIKKYHSALSEIIRRYTEQRFQFIALELTTTEIIEELKNKLNIEQLDNLRTLLTRADLAKFAKSKPIDTENKESMILAKNFVNNTKLKKDNE